MRFNDDGDFDNGNTYNQNNPTGTEPLSRVHVTSSFTLTDFSSADLWHPSDARAKNLPTEAWAGA